MAEDRRLVITTDPSLNAEDVSRRTFGTAFRGWDPAEVRAYLGKVAKELAAARQRVSQLERQLGAVKTEAAHPELDEAAITSALGEEAARILRTAREAASDIKGRAEESIERVLRQAHEEGARIRTEAEALLADRLKEADEAADGVRQQADLDSQRVVEEARQHGRDMLREAQAMRAKVLGDLARRRKLAQVQVAQLRAGRERLLDAYRMVRRSLDEVSDELQRADAEARLAAEQAALRVAEVPELTVDELTASLTVQPPVAEADEPGPAEPVAPSVQPSPTAPPPGAELSLVEAPSDIESVRIVPAHPESGEPEHAEVEADATAAIEAEAPPEAVSDAGPEPQQEQDPEPEAEPEPDRVEEPAAEAEADEESPAQEAEPAAAAAERPIDDLFARIRADRAEAVARAQQVLHDSAVPHAAPLARPHAGDGGEAQPSPSPAAVASIDDGLVRRRDSELQPLEATLARRLKRALQDDQNELLDRLRSHRGPVTVESLLPGVAEHGAGFLRAGDDLLVQAGRAGAAFAGERVASLPDMADLVAAVADGVVGPLRARLARGVSEALAEGDDEAVLVERIGAAYREWKTQRIERLATDQVVAAFSRGFMAATPPGTALRWVVSDVGGPCPDCDDNALAGTVVRGDAYPTGQPHPPAHPGCRCLLVQAPA